VIETPTQTLADTGTVQFNTDPLESDTGYDVYAVAEASVDAQTVTEYSDRTTFTTEPQ
jgi:hypothetical protein